MSKSITGIVAWLKNWFYDESEVDGFVTTLQNSINSKLNSNLTEANKNLVTNGSGTVVLEDKPVIPDVSGKIDTAGTGLSKSGTTLNHSNSVTAQTSAVAKKIKYDGQGHITGTSTLYGSDIAVSSSDSTKINTALSDKANSTHTHSATDVTDSNAHTNIGSSANANQGAINTAIDTAIGNLSSIRAIEVVSTLPTASSSTMGKLYIISENSKVNVYYTEQSGSSYSWHKMDTDILDELSVAWNDITGKPSTFTPSGHNHGADEVIDDNYTLYTALISVLQGGQQQHINYAVNYVLDNHDDAIGDLISDLTGKAPTSHSSSATTYGVGTTSNYGHNKVINNLTTSTYSDGNSLSAYQGYVLKGLIDAKQEITSIVLVDKAVDSSGKIIFYTGDEPT